MIPQNLLTATCELCGNQAMYVDVAQPDKDIPGSHPNETGYRAALLCSTHASERDRESNTCRIHALSSYAAEIWPAIRRHR